MIGKCPKLAALLGGRLMARITIEDCTRLAGNRFRRVLMASIRSKQLMRGARPLVQAEENKEAVISLREIASGKVKADGTEDS